MKVILAGSSGFIGAEVLRQCLHNRSITSIIALSRRELPLTDLKLKTVLVKDWTRYEPEILAECEGAECCIWTLGVKTSDVEVQKQVALDYTLAAAEAFSSLCVRLPLPPASSSAAAAKASPSESKSTITTTTTTTKPQNPPQSPPPSPPPFRFVFASGILAVRDPSQSVWFGAGARRAKGEAETRLLDFSAAHADAFDAFIVRPGAVLENAQKGVAGWAVRMGAPIVGLQGLAAVMVELAVRGAGDKVWENSELLGRGRELLSGEKKEEGNQEGEK